MIQQSFWKGKKVFITGHTGFKGSWLCLWLHSLGAEITGYSLEPPTIPSLFEQCKVNELVYSIIGDIRDYNFLSSVIKDFDPDIIFHLAAQPLVRQSYSNPIETYETNVIGTVNLLDAVRKLTNTSSKKRALVNITSDKCYENKEWLWGYREPDTLGGYDPYSNSKACAELATSCYTHSFFNPNNYSRHLLALASARAGNVIGGGDWASDRLVPDCLSAILNKKEIRIRNPQSIRPWQHVLEPLNGYISLAEKLYRDGVRYNGPWNFGPNDEDVISVEGIVHLLYETWGEKEKLQILNEEQPHEANLLKLDCSKAKSILNWKPRWNIAQSILKVVEWTKAYQNQKDLRELCLVQITEYENAGVSVYEG
ncbi:CDP-glucose 4,6-dehydratase [Bacillus salipaludis]|uniref:CDP-glucose 4,6-dehydratase n=1 Tax=Bacillus salipaludis TaxID=2547811 RepID=A0A4R5VQL3_9BACI|nr:CDP-glucose 4,6-dehydratase [Bacillus salipaludis]MDQ6598587.1 CDP-glucose 4,6-dehydratase [Bacillus salipaludis]TDK60863.1 CDP-glucose 4,6-dehydratase [Bacillus salipaludis]